MVLFSQSLIPAEAWMMQTKPVYSKNSPEAKACPASTRKAQASDSMSLTKLSNISTVVLSEIKDVDRFKTPAHLAEYAGCAPRRLESGKHKRHIKTRSGNRRLNKALYQIALTQISNRGIDKAKKYFQKKVKEGKSKKHALTCLKRQIIDIVWSMIEEKRAYYS